MEAHCRKRKQEKRLKPTLDFQAFQVIRQTLAGISQDQGRVAEIQSSLDNADPTPMLQVGRMHLYQNEHDGSCGLQIRYGCIHINSTLVEKGKEKKERKKKDQIDPFLFKKKRKRCPKPLT